MNIFQHLRFLSHFRWMQRWQPDRRRTVSKHRFEGLGRNRCVQGSARCQSGNSHENHGSRQNRRTHEWWRKAVPLYLNTNFKIDSVTWMPHILGLNIKLIVYFLQLVLFSISCRQWCSLVFGPLVSNYVIISFNTLNKVQKIRVILGRSENSFSFLQWLFVDKQIWKHKKWRRHISQK